MNTHLHTRRAFIAKSALGLASACITPHLFAAPTQWRISARHFGGDCAAAKRAGMDGVEPGVGGPADKLEIADPNRRKGYLESSKANGVAISSLSMDLLNGNPLFKDPRAPAWVEQTIDAAHELGAVAILVPFFGEANLLSGKEFKKAETDKLVSILKDLAPKAKAAGVALGIECTLSAAQYIQLLDRVGTEGVGAYYDIGNTTNAGLDVPNDIKALKGRIACIHFKDNDKFLGEGRVKMEPVAQALHEIDYRGWIVLEAACPTKNAEADCKRNGEYIRKLMSA